MSSEHRSVEKNPASQGIRAVGVHVKRQYKMVLVQRRSAALVLISPPAVNLLLQPRQEPHQPHSIPNHWLTKLLTNSNSILETIVYRGCVMYPDSK